MGRWGSAERVKSSSLKTSLKTPFLYVYVEGQACNQTLSLTFLFFMKFAGQGIFAKRNHFFLWGNSHVFFGGDSLPI